MREIRRKMALCHLQNLGSLIFLVHCYGICTFRTEIVIYVLWFNGLSMWMTMKMWNLSCCKWLCKSNKPIQTGMWNWNEHESLSWNLGKRVPWFCWQASERIFMLYYCDKTFIINSPSYTDKTLLHKTKWYFFSFEKWHICT